jgi:predicted nucleic acid-binding protein
LTTFFVDTSALAKRYLTETGTRWTRRQIRPSAGNIVVVSELTTIGMFSLLARRVRENTISLTYSARVRTTFLRHMSREYLTIVLSEPVLLQARNLVSKYPLRSLDAIQLACVQDAVSTLNEPMTFVSGDTNLLAAAASEGFATDNPNLHP